MKNITNKSEAINSEPEYVKVSSISLTADGRNYYEKSTYKITSVGEAVECTEEEYTASAHKFNEMAIGTNYSLEKGNATVISHNGLTEDSVGEFYYSYDEFTNSFYKREFAGFKYTYVYVKILDDDTVKVKTDNTEVTYKVTRYSITYFDN